MNIEEYMFPESNKLHIIKCKEEHYPDDEYNRYLMELIDAEMDPFVCEFFNDDCVRVDTENLSYVWFTSDNLRKMLKTILKVEKLEKKSYENRRK